MIQNDNDKRMASINLDPPKDTLAYRKLELEIEQIEIANRKAQMTAFMEFKTFIDVNIQDSKLIRDLHETNLNILIKAIGKNLRSNDRCGGRL